MLARGPVVPAVLWMHDTSGATSRHPLVLILRMLEHGSMNQLVARLLRVIIFERLYLRQNGEHVVWIASITVLYLLCLDERVFRRLIELHSVGSFN